MYHDWATFDSEPNRKMANEIFLSRLLLLQGTQVRLYVWNRKRNRDAIEINVFWRNNNFWFCHWIRFFKLDFSDRWTFLWMIMFNMTCCVYIENVKKRSKIKIAFSAQSGIFILRRKSIGDFLHFICYCFQLVTAMKTMAEISFI